MHMEKSEYIEYAKGFSILTIVIFHLSLAFHLPKLLGYAANFGGAGVHLFFFCSGFGLASSKYIDYVSFLKRRLNKVLVPYYFTITIIFLINIIVKIYPNGFPEYLSHIFLYKMFFSKYEESFGPQFWFISTIIQFYLVFPLLLWLANSGNYKTILIFTLAFSLIYSLIVSLSPYANERVFNGFFIQYLWEFMLGMTVAKTRSLNKLINQPITYYFIIAAICIPLTALLAIKGGRIGKNFNDIFSFSAYTSIVIILYRLIKPFNKFILWISEFSYSLYLIHMFVFNCLFNALVLNTFKLLTVPFIFIIIILAAYYYNFVLIKVNNLITTKRQVLYKNNAA